MEKKRYKIITFVLIPLFILILSSQVINSNFIKTTEVVNAHPNILLYPGGEPIGVKLTTKGVLVIALSDIEGTDGKVHNPSSENGIKVGDSIIKIDGNEINSCEDISKYVKESEGKELNVVIDHKGKISEKKIKPIKKSKENKYKIGLWVRDSTAGIGTFTFYDPKSKKFGALGHAITDVDTGDIFKAKKGEMISSSIISIKKGEKGTPGELKGIFVNEENILGNVKKNCECGIFGDLMITPFQRSEKNGPLRIAYKDEIKEGKAQILTTIDGQKPKKYDIEIQELFHQNKPSPKSMIIKITDKRLLNKTGGIIQGMSGSPIIQNNKIVGAVTHVLVNKPNVGYGVYIEWMLKESNII